MASLRHRAACTALLLATLQTAAVVAAPLASCCVTASRATVAAEDCCPAGSHPPGQCPLHRDTRSSGPNDCRLTCSRQSSTPWIAGVVGIPAHDLTFVAPVQAPARSVVPATAPVLSLEITPASPPPKTAR